MSNLSLLGHATVTRGENRRDVQLADLILIDLEDETPKSDESAPCMIMTMRQEKQNQHGKIEYMGCMRNLEQILCSLSVSRFRRLDNRRTTMATTSSRAASECQNGL